MVVAFGIRSIAPWSRACQEADTYLSLTVAAPGNVVDSSKILKSGCRLTSTTGSHAGGPRNVHWIPACAGMTIEDAHDSKKNAGRDQMTRTGV
jgi:hypothetical protein